MAGPKIDSVVKSIDAFFAEKQALEEKQKSLIDSLNGLLAEMGYKIVPINSVGLDGRRGRRRGRKPGRPRVAPTGPAAVAQAPRRRGRPPKVKAGD